VHFAYRSYVDRRRRDHLAVDHLPIKITKGQRHFSRISIAHVCDPPHPTIACLPGGGTGTVPGTG
jgi:hypothetical protein